MKRLEKNSKTYIRKRVEFMELLQKIYIIILTPFCNITGAMNDKVRQALLGLVCFLLYSTCYIWYSIIGFGHDLHLIPRMLVSILLIMLLIVLGLDKELNSVKFNKVFFYPWFLIGILIFVLGFFIKQNLGYWMTGPVLAFGLPCFFMVYGESDKYKTIFDNISKSAMIWTFIFFVGCLIGEFYKASTWVDSGQYNGLTTDANKIGELCLASYCCIMYYLLTGRSKVWRVISVISLGIVIGQTYLTQSRTTILSMVLIMCFYLFILAKDKFFDKVHFGKNVFMNNIVPVVLACFIAVGTVSITYFVHECNVQRQENMAMSELFIESSYALSNDADVDILVAEGTEMEYRQMLPTEGQDMNSFSSGRVYIWQTYAEGFNLFGNSADAAHPISPLIAHRTAHNSFVEFTYRSGYITGFVYAFFELVLLVYVFKVAFRHGNKNRETDYLAAMAAIAYLIFTNLMPSYNPLTAIIFLLLVIVYPAMLERRA